MIKLCKLLLLKYKRMMCLDNLKRKLILTESYISGPKFRQAIGPLLSLFKMWIGAAR